MEELINEMYAIIGDFRNDEQNTAVQMTPNRIRRWINQFEEVDREFILTELTHIFKKRYLSKAAVKKCLKEGLLFMKEHFKYSTVLDLILETKILSLQRLGKSQSKMLEIFNEVLRESYNIDEPTLVKLTIRNHLYIDDVLCTGNTFYQDILKWANTTTSSGRSNWAQMQNDEIRLWALYLIIHSKNYFKKLYQFRRNIDSTFENHFTMMRNIEIENSIGGKLDLIYPCVGVESSLVSTYRHQITATVNEYCRQNSISEPSEEYYRPSAQPTTEVFFTSSENRMRLETILLKKGIEILNTAQANIPNMRALGFSLPSHKNFGFGTLCMTWRNIPNNCPIVFWYSGGGFFPLFVKHST